MGNSYRRAVIWSGAVAMVAVATLSVRAARVLPQVSIAAQVQQLPKGDPVVVPPGQKGATYYYLESQTRKLTTHFPAVTATAERDTVREAEYDARRFVRQ